MRSKLIRGAVLTFEHSQLGKTGQQDQLQPPPASPNPPGTSGGGTGLLINAVKTNDAVKQNEQPLSNI